MAHEYLQAVEADYSRLNLPLTGGTHTPLAEQWRLKDLHVTLDHPNTIETHAYTDIALDAPHLETDLGKSTVTLIKTATEQFVPARMDLAVCCPMADQNLLYNLDNALCRDHSSPTIITRNEEMLGIVKTKGEATFYSFVDEPEIGLIKGAFASIQYDRKFKVLPRTNHVWVAPPEELGAIVPMRFSVFAVPPRERETLKSGTPRDRLLDISHVRIVEQAEDLLKRARYIPRIPRRALRLN